MATAIRAFDWTQTALGPLDSWSQTLVSFVNLLVCSPLPATLSWGPDLIFLYNDAAIPTLGTLHPGALGRQYQEVFQEAWPHVRGDLEGCLNRGETPVRENVMIPLLRDGRLTERFWTYSLIPVYESGRVVAVYNPYQDTTAGIVAQREREAATLLLQQALEVTEDGVFSLDRNWNFTYLNGKARKMLQPSGELVGRNYWEAYPENDHEDSVFFKNYHRAMDEGIPSDFEGYYPEPYESWFQAIVRPTSQGITVFFRDVTANRRATAALIQSEKLAAMGRLAASIAHEVNNPLESVTNLIYLARTSGDFEAAREYLESADRELSRAAGITNQTLRFHKQSADPTQTASDSLLREVMTMHQGRIMNCGVQVEERLRSTCPVLCFEGEIRQVLSNLIGNATDAMQSSAGHLFVRSRDGHNWKTGETGLILTVADTGPGMSSKTLKRVFEAFYTTKGMSGTGLGLWVSQEIVARHHGELRVRSSEATNHHGTVFALFLPHKAAIRSASD
jgi:PAS domain S-box-containing protein